MTRVHIFCEGQTEETFVRELLTSHFAQFGIWVNPIILRTSKIGKGGISTYGKVKFQIEQKCREDPTAWVTTLIDFYGLPSDFPNSTTFTGTSSIDRAEAIQKQFQEDIAQPNFIANLLIHEFEGLLFSDPEVFRKWFDEFQIIDELINIRNSFDSPEHINNSSETAPSKRILSLCNQYEKVLHGTLISLDIGLETIRQEFPIFNSWINYIEKLA